MNQVTFTQQKDRGSRLNGLQIFRGMAAVLVLLHHINLQFSGFVPGTPDLGSNPVPWTAHRLGFLGVDFFFVLSGFIIYHIHRCDLGLANRSGMYFIKRFLRIQPLLWIIIVVKQSYLTIGIGESVKWNELVNTIFCFPGNKIIGVAWTLTFEWMFYLFFLVCIICGKRWLWAGSAIWTAVVLIAGHYDLSKQSPWLQVAASPYVFQFLSGVAAAEFHRRFTVCTSRISLPIFGLSIVLVIAGLFSAPFNMSHRDWAAPSDMTYGRVYWGLAFGCLVWWTSTNERYFTHRLLAPLILIGNASYSIYLFHNEMLQAFIRIGKKFNFFGHSDATIWMWAYTLIILSACLLLHFLIEAPILKLGRRIIPHRQA